VGGEQGSKKSNRERERGTTCSYADDLEKVYLKKLKGWGFKQSEERQVGENVNKAVTEENR